MSVILEQKEKKHRSIHARESESILETKMQENLKNVISTDFFEIESNSEQAYL